MQLFYTPDIKSNKYVLSEQESKHCVRVLRMKNGDNLYLTDGQGTLFKAQISDSNAKACALDIIETSHEYEKRNYHVHIAIAPTKNSERFEWFLEKATEIGVDEITPLLCENSERKVIKTERLERIIVSAMKQSLKAYRPILNPLTKLNNFISEKIPGKQRFIAHCNPGEKKLLKSLYRNSADATILIGPEGDFSPEETNKALTHGYLPISLGNARLRTETAGIVCCNAINILNQ